MLESNDYADQIQKHMSTETFRRDDERNYQYYLRGTLELGVIPSVDAHDLGWTVMSRVCDLSTDEIVLLGTRTQTEKDSVVNRQDADIPERELIQNLMSVSQ